jgi:hypothetical protein
MSGILALLLMGGNKVQLPVTSATSFSTGTTSTAQLQFASSGDINGTNGSNAVTDRGDWVVPKLNMGDYDIRVILTSGTFTSGTNNTWENLGTSRTWTKAGSIGGGLVSCAFTVEIRHSASGTVLVGPTAGGLTAEATL